MAAKEPLIHTGGLVQDNMLPQYSRLARRTRFSKLALRGFIVGWMVGGQLYSSFAGQGPPTSPKENMTPAGLAPAPVAVLTCSREARRLINVGTEGRAPLPKRPARGREIDVRLRLGPLDKNRRALPSRTA